jgi:tight adherence protein B
MFGETFTILAIAILATLSAGAMAYAFLFSRVTEEQRTSGRLEAITDRQRINQERRTASDANARRRSIQDTLKDFEARQQSKLKQTSSPPLSVRLQQAGLNWNRKGFLIFSAGAGAVFAFCALIGGMDILVVIGAGIIGALGFPRWYVGFLKKRRLNQFLEELPNAVDVIVRGVKSGLPLGDCLRIISVEAREPLRSEFRLIIETQQLGVPIGDACQKLYERVPVQEANFFGIVISIQQKAGGNLSETLGNLSRVLRDRKKMRAKISAMSMEAKASAGIIGSLPIIVSGLVYLTSPSYMMILFTTKAGNMIIVAGLMVMLSGVLVMRKMINFDF